MSALCRYQEVIQGDLDACLSVAQQYPKNYHAWTHRLLLTHTCVPPILLWPSAHIPLTPFSGALVLPAWAWSR